MRPRARATLCGLPRVHAAHPPEHCSDLELEFGSFLGVMDPTVWRNHEFKVRLHPQ